MSKLIQLRARIKAIETIQKVTHAMRLISMSSHTRLKKQQEPISRYLAHIEQLLANTAHLVPEWNHPLTQASTPSSLKEIVIVVGSQRSLCGSFNATLMHQLTAYLKPKDPSQYIVIAIGKKIIELLRENFVVEKEFNNFTTHTIHAIAFEISQLLLNAPGSYASVLIVSNEQKSFFVQNPTKTVLFPYNLTYKTAEQSVEELIWEHNPIEILNRLMAQYIETYLYNILFKSLLAEQAARFISMDSSTRNAKNLLETTQLQYNKLRQSKITKELTELSAHYTT